MNEPRGTIRILSWNLLHSVGAVVDDVAALVESERPDLLVMQEVTPAIDALPALIGGFYARQDWPGRRHGLAAWCRHRTHGSDPLALPWSRLPGRLPQRFAQLLRLDALTVANVHLSHGQVLNRRQLQRIARSTCGPTAIIGDFNSLGPIVLRGFVDVGPSGHTHRAQRLVPFRLDRCMARQLACVEARTLHRGPSDHHPICLDFQTPHGSGPSR